MLFSTCYTDISCGGRIRTCDLQVMSLASYQLLHSAMFNLCCLSISELRVQRYCDFLKVQNNSGKNIQKSGIIDVGQVFAVIMHLFRYVCHYPHES